MLQAGQIMYIDPSPFRGEVAPRDFEASSLAASAPRPSEKYFSTIPYLFCISSNAASRHSSFTPPAAGGIARFATGRAAASTDSFEIAATTE
jgi:hypothetical protein